MHYAFVMYPHARPGNSIVFLHETIKKIEGFKIEVLQDIINDSYGYGSEYDVGDMNFFEIGEFKPITFEKRITYVIDK